MPRPDRQLISGSDDEFITAVFDTPFNRFGDTRPEQALRLEAMKAEREHFVYNFCDCGIDHEHWEITTLCLN